VKGHPLDSKILLAVVIVAAVVVILAPILNILTRKKLQYAREKDMENLSGEKHDMWVSFLHLFCDC